MKKQVIRLTEADLYRIIENSLDDIARKKEEMDSDWAKQDSDDYWDYRYYDRMMDDNYWNDSNGNNLYDNEETMYNAIMGTKALRDWDDADKERNLK